MKRFDSGEALAKEMGIPPAYLKKTFEIYNAGAKAKKDPFGKKVIAFFGLLYPSNQPVFLVLLVWGLVYG